MNEASPSQNEPTEVDSLYRRLSALDSRRPGEWVRRKVQAYAAQQAAERALRESSKGREAPSPVVAPAPVHVPPSSTRSARPSSANLKMLVLVEISGWFNRSPGCK